MFGSNIAKMEVGVCNAPSHRSTLVADYLTKNHILTPDMAPCDFYLFGKMHLPMKGKRYADVEAI